MPQTAPDPILVSCFPAIGDFIRCHTLVRLLAARHPGRTIDVVTSTTAAPLAALMSEVRQGHGLRTRHNALGLTEKLALAGRLRAERYRTVYVIQSSLKSALAPAMAGIPERIGWFGELRYPLINRPRFARQGRRRMLDDIALLALDPGETILPELPEPRLSAPAAALEAFLDRPDLGDPAAPAIAIIPSAANDPRGWPIERFVAVARNCVELGYRVWLVGHERERAGAAAIMRAAPAVDLTGTSLANAAVQLAAASAVIGTDGGLIHLAAGLGKPVVAIFGYTDPWKSGPINRQVRFVTPEGYDPDFQGPAARRAALLELEPDAVMQALPECLGEDLAWATPARAPRRALGG